MVQHLRNLQTPIRKYFTSPKEDTKWLRNPFSASTEDLDLPIREVEKLMNLAAYRNLKDTFKPAPQFEFLPLLRNKYPIISNYAVQLLPCISNLTSKY
jgi:hypothetical protein